MDDPHRLNTVSCRVCPGNMVVTETRQSVINGVLYVRRRKKCTNCGARYSTAELPLEVACDVFGED